MSKHLKRLASPRAWKIPKKTAVWVTKPRPGAHAVEGALPLSVILRDYLHLAGTAREASRIVGDGAVMVDGRVVRDTKFAVGLQDVVSIVPTKQHFRMLMDRKGRLALVSIPESAAAWKLCRIEGKNTVPGGRRQLNLHDGRNVLVKEDSYQSGDVVKLRVPTQEIAGHFPFKPGAPAFITGGAHVGEVVAVQAEIPVAASSPNRVQCAGATQFETIKPYVFVVGDKKAEITPPEEVIA